MGFMSLMAKPVRCGYVETMETVEIERLGLAGDGIARHGGTDVFVPFSLPDEIVSGTLVDRRIEKARIEQPSPDRIQPVCRNFGSCGGCALQHASDTWLANWKSGTIIRALAARELPAPVRAVRTSPPKSRRRATLSGRRTKKTVVVGFHQRASDDIVPLSECHLINPEITAALPALEDLTRCGASRSGQIRLLVTHFDAGLDVCVADAKPTSGPLLVQLASLAATHDLARLSWNGELIVTRRMPEIRFGNACVVPPPGAFLQATDAGEAALTSAVHRAVGPATRVADLFAGCGTFALPLAAGAEVHAVENDTAMLGALDAGGRAATELKPLTFEARDLFRRPLLPAELNGFDAVVIDPPRAGAEAQMRQLAASQISRVATVSCNPVTFARDASILSKAGFQIDWIEIIDQFRWSGHVELVAQMSR